jgi:hypothetical protein
MAMLLVVVSTEATDPMRESEAFASAVIVSELSAKRVRDEPVESTTFGEGGI